MKTTKFLLGVAERERVKVNSLKIMRPKRILDTARKKQLPSVAGRMMPTPKDALVLSPGTCEHVGLHGKGIPGDKVAGQWR